MWTCCVSTVPVAAQGPVQNDPAEPMQNSQTEIWAAGGAIQRGAVDEKSMPSWSSAGACVRAITFLVDDLARRRCGGPNRHASTDLANASGGKLQVVVDKFSLQPRQKIKPAHMENVYAILPGSDPTHRRRYSYSGHFALGHRRDGRAWMRRARDEDASASP